MFYYIIRLNNLLSDVIISQLLFKRKNIYLILLTLLVLKLDKFKEVKGKKNGNIYILI